MDSVARKLQYKENFRCLVLDNPANISWDFIFDETRREKKYDLEILFVYNLPELQDHLPHFLTADDDRLQWIAYPKKSGGLSSDINRDNIWTALTDLGHQPVSMISLDADWSIMRVRNSRFVKSKPKEKTTIPQALKSMLAKNPECHDYFHSLSNTNQKEYIQWINSAKKEETRSRRLTRTRSLLRDKVPNPYSGR